MWLTYLYEEVLVALNLKCLKSLQRQNTFAQQFFCAKPLSWAFKNVTCRLYALEGYNAKWKALLGEEMSQK